MSRCEAQLLMHLKNHPTGKGQQTVSRWIRTVTRFTFPVSFYIFLIKCTIFPSSFPWNRSKVSIWADIYCPLIHWLPDNRPRCVCYQAERLPASIEATWAEHWAENTSSNNNYQNDAIIFKHNFHIHLLLYHLCESIGNHTLNSFKGQKCICNLEGSCMLRGAKHLYKIENVSFVKCVQAEGAAMRGVEELTPFFRRAASQPAPVLIDTSGLSGLSAVNTNRLVRHCCIFHRGKKV